MNNYPLIDEVMSPSAPHELITFRRRNPIATIIVALAGIGLAVWSLSANALADYSNLTSTLMLTGGLTALVALIRLALILKSEVPVYVATGETVRRKELYYAASAESVLSKALDMGSLQKIRSIERSANAGGLLLTIYSTESGSFAMGQLSRYVSYTFEPLSDIVRLQSETERATA